jgi:5-(carboxyamino)imidazole ribonucleotide synthase
MYNIIGTVPDLTEVNKLSNAHVHLYGKAERTGRKLGHITLLNPSESEELLVDGLCAR